MPQIKNIPNVIKHVLALPDAPRTYTNNGQILSVGRGPLKFKDIKGSGDPNYVQPFDEMNNIQMFFSGTQAKRDFSEKSPMIANVLNRMKSTMKALKLQLKFATNADRKSAMNMLKEEIAEIQEVIVLLTFMIDRTNIENYMMLKKLEKRVEKIEYEDLTGKKTPMRTVQEKIANSKKLVKEEIDKVEAYMAEIDNETVRNYISNMIAKRRMTIGESTTVKDEPTSIATPVFNPMNRGRNSTTSQSSASPALVPAKSPASVKKKLEFKLKEYSISDRNGWGVIPFTVRIPDAIKDRVRLMKYLNDNSGEDGINEFGIKKLNEIQRYMDTQIVNLFTESKTLKDLLGALNDVALLDNESGTKYFKPVDYGTDRKTYQRYISELQPGGSVSSDDYESQQVQDMLLVMKNDFDEVLQAADSGEFKVLEANLKKNPNLRNSKEFMKKHNTLELEYDKKDKKEKKRLEEVAKAQAGAAKAQAEALEIQKREEKAEQEGLRTLAENPSTVDGGVGDGNRIEFGTNATWVKGGTASNDFPDKIKFFNMTFQKKYAKENIHQSGIIKQLADLKDDEVASHKQFFQNIATNTDIKSVFGNISQGGTRTKFKGNINSAIMPWMHKKMDNHLKTNSAKIDAEKVKEIWRPVVFVYPEKTLQRIFDILVYTGAEKNTQDGRKELWRDAFPEIFEPDKVLDLNLKSSDHGDYVADIVNVYGKIEDRSSSVVLDPLQIYIEWLLGHIVITKNNKNKINVKFTF